MRRTLVLMLAGVALLQGATYRVHPRPEAGQQFEVEVTRSREGTGASLKSRSRMLLEVVRAHAKGSVLRWSALSSESLTPVSAEMKGLYDAAAKGSADLKLDVRLDEAGRFAEVLNQDEVSARLGKTVEEMISKSLQEAPASERQRMQGQMRQILSPAALIGSATRDLQFLFGLAGMDLDSEAATQLEIETPNPMGGGTIPSTLTLRLSKLTESEAVVATEQHYDTRALVDALIKMIGKELEGGMPELKSSDAGEFVFDTKSGMLQRMHHVRKMEGGPLSRSDTTDIVVRLRAK